jgi:tetratricopeptide (TPR) repeat protein
VRSKLLALLVFLPLALVAEATALVLLLMADGPLPPKDILALLCFHLFSAAAAAEALERRYRPDDAAALGAWRLALALALLLPGFGVVILAVLAVRRPQATSETGDDGISPMEYRKQRGEAERAAEADRGTADANVEAISEALKDEDKAKRLGAVEALRALQNKQAIELLNKSLKNTVFEVRYQAVEALAGINTKYSDRISIATAAVDRDPSPANTRALGEVFFEYASLDMEDLSIQLHLHRSALAYLKKSIRPGEAADPEVLIKIAACLEKVGEEEQALEVYRAALEQRAQSVDALFGVARLQFKRGEFSELASTCRLMLEIPATDPQVVGVLRLWADGPRAGAQGKG